MWKKIVLVYAVKQTPKLELLNAHGMNQITWLYIQEKKLCLITCNINIQVNQKIHNWFIV